MERRRRLAEWWATAASTVWANTWEARFWLGLGLLGVLFKSVRESIPLIFFMSAYANRKASLAVAQEAKMEMKEEEAHE